MNFRKRSRGQVSDYDEYEYAATDSFRESISKPPPYQNVIDDSMAIQSNGYQRNDPIISRDNEADGSEEEETCTFERFSKHKPCQLRFLVWVAYVRNNASNKQISSLERRTCPSCREDFSSPEAMLEHIYHCSYLFNGLHICSGCQKPGRTGRFEYNRYQGKPSRAERLASGAKKIFSRLGTKSQKSGPLPSRLQTEDSGHSRPSPLFASRISTPEKSQAKCTESEIPELPNGNGNQIFEIENTPKSIYELNNNVNRHPYVQMSEAYEMPGQFEQPSELAGTSFRGFDVPKQEHRWDATQFLVPSQDVPATRSRRGSLSVLPPLDTKSTRISVHQEVQTPSDSPDSESVIISPMGAQETRIIDPAFLQVSPTDSEKSGNSFPASTDSGYQSWDTSTTYVNSATTDGENELDWEAILDQYNGSTPTSIPDLSWRDQTDVNEIQNCAPSARESTGSTTEKAFSPNWSDRPGLVTAFSQVFEKHLEHSRSKLKEMPQSETVRELGSMSLISIVSTGLDVLASLLEGRRPTSIMALFALTHVAYAFAIVLEDEPSSFPEEEWYQELVFWIAGLPHLKERSTYSQIAARIWRPEGCPNPPQMEHLELASTAFLESKLVKVSKHFLDILESFHQPEAHRSISVASFAYQPSQPTFMLEQFKHNVGYGITFELMTTMGLGCFINNVKAVDVKLRNGLITDIRGLELQLICAGKFSSQSGAIYWGFLDHVARLCDSAYTKHHSTMSRTDYHLRDIEVIRYMVQEVIDIGSNMDLGDSFPSGSDSPVNDQQPKRKIAGAPAKDRYQMLYDGPVNPFPQLSPTTHSADFEVFQFQFEPPTAPQDGTGGPHQNSNKAPVGGPTPTPETKLKCQYCGYEPNGKDRWKTSNLTRHIKHQHRHNEKSRLYACAFPDCESRFTRSDNLKQHHRQKHGDESTQLKRYVGRPQKRRKGADEKESENFF